MTTEITLGQKVRDKISGLVGIATARCTYLNGCDHIAIQPPAKDGKIPPSQWVDLPQVEVVEELRPVLSSGGGFSGGPADHPEDISDDSDASWRSEDRYSR